MDAESCGEAPPFAALAADHRHNGEMVGAATLSDSDDTCILGGDDGLRLVASKDDHDDDDNDDDDDLPFALSSGPGPGLGLTESFLAANDALGLSLAATTISTRSATSDDYRQQQALWGSPRTDPGHASDDDDDDDCHPDESESSSDAFYTPRTQAHAEPQQPQPQTTVRDPTLSSDANTSIPTHLASPNVDRVKPSPNCISQPVLVMRSATKSPPHRRYADDYDDRPSPAAAAAAEAAAKLYESPPPAAAPPSVSSSFILQSPLVEHGGSFGENDNNDDDEHSRFPMPLLQRRDAPRDEESGGTTTTASDLMGSPLFPSNLAGGDRIYQSTTSLGFSDLMRKAEGGGGEGEGGTTGGDSFALVSSPLRPVLEETPSREESKDGDDVADDRTSLTSTPPMSNVGIGGATIVPPAPSSVPSHAASPASVSPRQRSRRSPYRAMGPSVHTTQLSEDSFSVSTHLPPPCSVQEVVDVLANPDLLRLWCAPVRNAIITSEGLGADGRSPGASSRSSGGGGGGGREYDGEWVEITTPQLVSPSSSCTSYLYRGLTAAKAALGFQTEGCVKMFVERNRGQVGLSVGPFMGGVVADHTITVGDNCALLDASDHASGVSASPPATQSNGGVVITDTVRVRKDEDLVASSDGGYSCGLFGVLERYALPSISGYMTQAALSLENLCDVVCDGEACALAGTCSVDFSEDRGLGDDGCDGRTPLLS